MTVLVREYRDFDTIRDVLSSTTTKAIYKNQLLITFNQKVGYGGFIHNFKNYVLSKKSEYRSLAENDLKDAFDILTDYRKQQNTDDELRALNSIEKTLKTYHGMLFSIKDEVLAGNQSEAVDEFVAVHDAKAIDAFETLYIEAQKYSTKSTKSLNDLVDDRALFTLIVLFIIVICLFAYWYLAHIVRRLNKDSEQKALYLQQLNDSLPCGFIIADAKGNIHEVNEQVNQLTLRIVDLKDIRHIKNLFDGADDIKALKKLCALQKGHFSFKTNDDNADLLDIDVKLEPFAAGHDEKYIITIVDTSELQETQRQLRSSLSEVSAFNQLLNYHSSVSESDLEGNITHINDNFCSITGFSRRELIGQNHRILTSDKHSKFFWKAMWQQITAGKIWHGEVVNRRKDGSLYWIFSTIMPFKDEAGNIYKYVSARTDISKIKKAENEIHQLAYRDPLTHQPNMALFKLTLDESIEKLLKNSQLGKIVVADIHINDLMHINTTFGWDYGDKLIQMIAESIDTSDLGVEMVAKVAGERFAFTLHVEGDVEQAIINFKQQLFALFSTSFIVDDKPVKVAYSAGIVVYPDDLVEVGLIGQTANNINNYLELCKVQAQKSHGNNCARFSHDLLTNVSKRTMILHSIEEALANNEIYMVYQPQLSLADERIVGVEALMRWKKADGGYVSPGDFIPVLEVSDFIRGLTVWSNKQCFSDLVKIQRVAPECRLSLNISANFLTDDELIQSLDEAVKNYHFEPSKIELEVTESAIMTDMEKALSRINMIKDKGFRVSIDDFGTGHSSLSYLVQFPVDQLKIDKSFIRQITHHKQSLSVVNTIISLGKELNLDVIAEGVETQEQIDILKKNWCDEVQGFFYAKPMKLDELLVWYENTNFK
jgi:PAS domain S-box-containing protein/diguanylate cyclase (GGDEF)-like protein